MQWTARFMLVILQCWSAIFCDVLNNRLSRDEATLEYIDSLIEFEERKLSRYKKLHTAINERIDDPKWQQALNENLKHPINGLLLARELKAEKDRFVKIHAVKELEPNKNNMRASKHSYMDTLSSVKEIAELETAAASIITLQDTYLLDTNQLADGLLGGREGCGPLGANECVLLHFVALKMSAYEFAISWAEKALEHIGQGTSECDTSAAVLKGGIAFCYWKLGQLENSINAYQSVRDFDENFDSDHLQIVIKQYFQQIQNKLLPFQNIVATKQQSICEDPSRSSSMERYKQLCRGQIPQHQYIDPQITCSYKQDQPFLIMAPIKVEIVHRNPDVAIFREAISEAASNWLIDKRMAAMRPAMVTKNNNSFVGNGRTAKQSWFHKNSDYPVIQNLVKRASLMANLDVGAAGEEIQIANYDVGGFYKPHKDFFPDEEGKAIGRMATFLYYLTEPDAGGATVFPWLNISVLATKGDVLFWFNTHKNSMKGDLLTLHAGCPVLLGDKWILNHWIKHSGNQWIRPSSKNRYDTYNSLMLINDDN